MVNADIIITIIKAVVTRFVVLLLFISLFNLVAPWRRDALIYIYSVARPDETYTMNGVGSIYGRSNGKTNDEKYNSSNVGDRNYRRNYSLCKTKWYDDGEYIGMR